MASANDPATVFPIQNLPFGRFRRSTQAGTDWRIGIAIGDQVLDLKRAKLIDSGDMNRLMRTGRLARRCRSLQWKWACLAGSATIPTSAPASITR